MQRGLIDHRAGQERIAVFFQRDGQPAKPPGPLPIQMTLDADLIDRWGPGYLSALRLFAIILYLLCL